MFRLQSKADCAPVFNEIRRKSKGSTQLCSQQGNCFIKYIPGGKQCPTARLTDINLCAFSPDSGDICNGDSGGGLVTLNSAGGYFELTGVQSYNMGCNSSFEGRNFSRTQQISPVSPRRIQTAKRLDLRPSRDGLDQRQRRHGAVLQ